MAHLVRRPVPDHVPSGLVREFDFFTDPNFLADPWVAFDALADAPEIFWSPVGGQGYHGGGGYWFIHGYDAVREGFRRHDLFGASFGPGETSMPEAAECPAGVPLTVDPPDHARYRALLAEDFTPRAAAMLESKLRTLAADLIDSFAQRGSCEFVEEFGRPFPAAAFLALFGLPSAEWKRFVELAATILHPGGKAAAAAAAQEEINVILADLIASRQKDPRDDLMSHVLQRPFGDQPSPPRAVAESIAHLLFEAGLDTMTMALGHFFLFLATNPAHRQRLRDDPGVTANAVEELLRANSFITLPRFVKEDTTFRGVFMKKGDHVWLPTACGSRDPHSWERHDEVNFDRLAHRHLIFGAGPHRCLGSHLARLELRVAIEEFNTRIPEYSVAANYVPDYHGGIGMGLDSLRLVWDTQ